MWSKCCWGFLGFAHLLLHSRSSCCVFYGVLFPEVRGSLEEQAGGSVNQGLLFAVLSREALFTKSSLALLSFSRHG